MGKNVCCPEIIISINSLYESDIEVTSDNDLAGSGSNCLALDIFQIPTVYLQIISCAVQDINFMSCFM
jgi:hypothetical protein